MRRSDYTNALLERFSRAQVDTEVIIISEVEAAKAALKFVAKSLKNPELTEGETFKLTNTYYDLLNLIADEQIS